ncbi:Zn-dependent hydrolase [Methylobrevis albus]|uniref:Zn-dependent hydrolase n=1 Tax=Methylobrevis albus TaxID=2793297 RepID=A0A931MXU1_9HYPH|nr:Zn-dependent hydrolase [Methylobrevis albus]MBH0236364.1 Zn-dependent hydrolase [Methylobrevis albus]
MLDTKNTAGKPVVDPAGLVRLMDALSDIGGGPDGAMNRLTLSEEDRVARDWLVAFMQDEGMQVAVDPAGNIVGTLDWAGPDAPLVMTGSHIDSQPNGGRFDGAYGVVAAMAAVKAVKDAAAAAGIAPKANLAIVDWTNEEGARFQPSLLGSGYFVGNHDLDFVRARRDGDGISVGAALDAIGYAGTAKHPLPDAYIELHIEGSDHLEKAGLKFATFTRYWGAVKYRLAFLGHQAHTGPTPMAERRDALLGAAYLIAELKAMADRSGVDLHTSVGRLEVAPNSPNVVPAEAVLFIELRSGSPETLVAAEAELKRHIVDAAARAGIGWEVRSVDYRAAGAFDRRLVSLAAEAAASHGLQTMQLDTIGGHDGVSMAPHAPSVVIAVPSVGGVIHHPTEFTTEDDRLLGAQILADMLWRFCTEDDLLETRGA